MKLISDIKVNLPGFRSPAVGCDEPFEMLKACHERVQRMLDLLDRARTHALTKGCDATLNSAFTDVMRYFDLAAPLHHLDEELHVFPIVLANGNQIQKEMVRVLIQDHETMAHLWKNVRSVLAEVIETPREFPVFSHHDNVLMNDFRNAYAKHISNEELSLYPASIQYMSNQDIAFMAEEMKVRRGVI
jgi:hemerythrin-like domain-containing protein